MDPFIGEIRIFSGSYAPKDWAFCEGQLLQISSYTALFSILGTRYGGNGRTTFALPDLRDRAPMNQGAGPGLTPRTIGEMNGSGAVALIESEMPAHTHIPNCRSQSGTDSPEGAVWAGTTGLSGPRVYSDTADKPMNPHALSVVGGGVPHNNMQPSLGIKFIIALQGVFPSRA
ncbi:phage tail protein [Paenibacillus tarimensis]